MKSNNIELFKVISWCHKLLRTIIWLPFVGYYHISKIFGKNIVLCECYAKYRGYQIKKNNWGDDINRYFFELVTGKKFYFVPYSYTFLKAEKHYSLIGSILDAINLTNTIVYGTGVKGDKKTFIGKPLKILMVRGPRTRDMLLSCGISCPKCYGDPALLLPLFYSPKTHKKGKIGVIPNMGSLGSAILDKYKTNQYEIIDLVHYNRWTDIIDKICSCKYIISESLHGIIVSETYGIPCVWVEFVKHPDYWSFKYKDYYESVLKNNERSIKMYENIDESIIRERIRNWEKPTINYIGMLDKFPFPIVKGYSI